MLRMSSAIVNQMLQSLATIFQSSNMVTRATRIYMKGLKEMDTSLILRDCQHILLVFIHLYGHVTIWNTPSKQGMREKVRAAKWWTRGVLALLAVRALVRFLSMFKVYFLKKLRCRVGGEIEAWNFSIK